MIITWQPSLEKVPPHLIERDQTGYITVRYIDENIRAISNLLKVLDIMNFDPSFLNWIHTFYKNISSCVINNGFSSEFFALQWGVRQGCPLSELLFAHQIRISESIKGLENGNKITKLSLYADDTTAFIRDDLSAEFLFE